MSQADGYVRIVTQNDTTEAQRSTEQLGDTIRDSLDTSQVDRMSDAFDGVRQGVEDTGEAALKTGDIIKANLISDVITQGIQKLGDTLKSMASHTIEIADGMNSAVNKIAAATNASAEDMEKLRTVVETIYGDNFGESAEDIADSISKIKQNLGELSDDELINITESAYALQDVFDYGVDESSRAVKAMVENFNISAAEAYDYIARGAQNGLDYSGELLDSISEYSVQFAKMGLSADDMFNIFSNGAENGAWNLDKIGDSVKELAIRVIDGSNTSKEGFEALGFEADSMAERFAAGGISARVAFQEVITALAEMDDPVAQNIAGVNLLGTMWEDMGADAVLALGDISDAAYDCAGAMDGIKDVNYNSLSNSIESVKRQIDLLIQPIGESLIPILNEAADTIAEVAQKGDLKEIATSVASFVSGTLTLLLKNIKLIASAVAGVTAGFIAFKTAALLTKVISSWQTAALQVKMLGTSQNFAAVKTAALNGQLTTQELIYAVLSGKLDIATAKQVALNTAMSLNPAGLIAAGVGLLATALTGFAFSASSASDDTENLNSSIDDLNRTANELNQTAEESDRAAREVHDLVDEYKSIKNASDNTEEAKQRLKAIQDTLVSTYDVEAEKLDLVNGKYKEQLGILEQVGDKKDEVAKLDAKAAYYAAIDSQSQGASYSLGEFLYGYVPSFEDLLGDINTKGVQFETKGTSNETREVTLKFDRSTSFEDRVNFLTEFANILDEKINDPTTDSDDRRNYMQTFQMVVDALNENSDSLKGYNSALDRYNYYYSSDGTTSSGSTSQKTPSSTSNNKSANYLPDYWDDKEKLFKEWKNDYKYDYEMGYISAEQYYTTLAQLRDQYLKVDSEEWRSVNLEIKQYYDKLTEDQKKEYDQRLADQQKAADEAAAARKQAYSDEKSQLEFKLKTNKITEKQYYEELAKIRDKYLDKDSAEWRSAFLEAYQYNQKILQANKDALNDMLSDTSDAALSALDKILSARDSLTQKLLGFNKDFEKVTETIPETIAVKGEFTITTAEHDEEVYKMGADSIEDNIKVLEEYGAMLESLKARGADSGTLNSILEMDIEEGMKYGAELLKMSDTEWNSYFSSLEKLNQTAASISEKYYQDQVDIVKESFVDKLRSVFAGLSSDMYQVGVDVAKEFTKGWNEKMGTEDLTLGDIMTSVSGGTLSTAPTAAKSMVSAAVSGAVGMANIPAVMANIPIYIGTQKLADLIVDITNGKIIQTGKNVLMT